MKTLVKILLGAQAIRQYDDIGKIPSEKEIKELGGILLEKDFKSKEEYKAYITALDESNGWDGWIVVEENQITSERESLDDIIKSLLKEGPLVALYFVTGINMLKEEIDDLSDKQVYTMFSGLLHPQRVRNNISFIRTKLNCFDK